MIGNISFCVLPHARQPQALERCVASLTKQPVLQKEILVSGEPCDLRGVQFVQPEGPAANLNALRNQLAARSTAEFVLLIADALALADDWYDAIRTAGFLDVVASRITAENGDRAIDWAYRVKLGSRSFAYPLDYDEWTTKAYVGGSLMLVRKATWERVRFDENIDDANAGAVDFSLRATRAGFKIGVFPGARAICHETGLGFAQSQAIVAAFQRALAAGQERFKKRDYNGAIEQLAQAVATVEDEPRALALMGWSYYFLGKYDAAVQWLDKALAADPNSHFALRGRGWTAMQQGDHDRAVDFLGRARALTTIDKRDDWIETLRGLAWSKYHIGNYDDAIADFAALRAASGPGETGLLQDLHRGLGWSCYRKGSMAEAAAHFNDAICAIGDGNPDLLKDARNGLELAGGESASVAPVKNDAALYPPIVSSINNQDVLAAAQPSGLRRRLAAIVAPLRRRLRS